MHAYYVIPVSPANIGRAGRLHRHMTWEPTLSVTPTSTRRPMKQPRVQKCATHIECGEQMGNNRHTDVYILYYDSTYE